MTPVANPPYSPNFTPSDFFASPNEKKVHKKKRFADVKEVKQKKMEEALKRIKIDEFKNCFEQLKNHLIGVLHQMGSTLKVIEV